MSKPCAVCDWFRHNHPEEYEKLSQHPNALKRIELIHDRAAKAMLTEITTLRQQNKGS